MRSLDLPELADLEGLSGRDLERVLHDVDSIQRRLEAIKAEIVGVAERTVAYADDGHASVTGWVKATCNYSPGEARAVIQTARLLHEVPEARVAAHAGAVGVPQLRLLARVFANPRSAEHFPAAAELLVGHAGSLWFEEFSIVLRRWEALADADGAHDAHERAHTGRDARVTILGERVYLDANGGIVAGAEIEEIFARFCDTEFQADWDAGVAQHGDAMVPALLQRTDKQRRFDALRAIFLAAAASGSVGGFDPLVNIIVDQTTLEHHLNRLAGIDIEPLDPATVDDRRCVHRPPTRPQRRARRGTHRPCAPGGARHRRCRHRLGSPLTTVHRRRPRRRAVG